MFPLAPPVNIGVLDAEKASEEGVAARGRLFFGPPAHLLGIPVQGSDDDDDAVRGRGRGAGRGEHARRPQRHYMTAHERLIRDAEEQREKNRRRRQKRREAQLAAEAAAQQLQDSIPPGTVTDVGGSAEGEAHVQDVAKQRRALDAADGTSKRPREPDFEPVAERTAHHRPDYQGRGVLFCRERVAVTAAAAPPAKLLHVFKGHSAGVQALAWVAPTAHLLLSADLGGVVHLWDAFAAARPRLATFTGHTALIKNVAASVSGASFSTSSLDGHVRVWDTEACQLTTSLTYRGAPCATHVYHPTREHEHLLLVGVEKRAVLFDVRTGQAAKVWEGHTQPLMSLTYLDNGLRFASTAEDKSLRTWDFRAAVPIKVVADVSMHAMPHCADHPHDGTFAAQSLDNKIAVFANDGSGKLTQIRDRALQGHVVSGTACRIDFSKDGALISSGDSSGALFVWDYASRVLLKKFRAHGKMLVAQLWHPLDGNKLVTSSWDGMVKLWG